MSNPEIRICSNVICLNIYDEEQRPVVSTLYRNIIPRLTYWELHGLNRALPLAFEPELFAYDCLNARQREEYNAFWEGDRITWPGDIEPGLTPYNPDDYEYDLRYRFPPVSPEDIQLLLKGITNRDSESEEESEKGTLTENETDIDISGAEIPEDNTLEDETENQGEDSAEKDGESTTQADFVYSPLDQSHLVFAPPGTGKTHALLDRIGHVVKNADLENPADEVVVLSFSRAAVREVRKRVAEAVGQGADGDFEYVTVRTFDSFATNVLLHDLDHDALTTGQPAGNESSFDTRIRKFNAGIDSGHLEKGIERIDKIRFLFVDEVQDLCGVRAEMVKLLVRRVLENGQSVALLGDPAQGIYDWQVRETGGMTSRQFLTGITTDFRDYFHEIHFSKYFRYDNEEMLDFAREAALAVGDGSAPDTRRLQKAADEKCSTVDCAEIKNLLSEVGDLAVLTRSNLEAWQFAGFCRRHSIPFELHRGASGRRWPEWIGRLLFGYKQDQMSETMFEKRWVRRIGDSMSMDMNQAWTMLEQEGLARSGNIDLRFVNRRILTEDVPEKWTNGKSSTPAILISTIHKSKGMEFPHVLVLEAKADSLMKNEEEARIFYVAVTRAKQKLYLLRRNNSLFPYRKRLQHDIYRYISPEVNGAFMDENQWDTLSILQKSTNQLASSELLDKKQQVLWSAWTTEERFRLPVVQKDGSGPYWLSSSSGDERVSLMKNRHNVERDLIWIKRIEQENSGKRFEGYSAEISALETIALEQTEINQDRMGKACLLIKPVLTELVLLEKSYG